MNQKGIVHIQVLWVIGVLLIGGSIGAVTTQKFNQSVEQESKAIDTQFEASSIEDIN